ncbi:hypothetical protein M1N68_01695 [Peptococcaceae bacterium]|nr:hypothetical protein [Peptococcaceae bacterium]
MFELSKCDHTIYNKLYNKLNRYDQYNKLYNLNRYDHTTANYVYAGGQKRPYACIQQEFKMEKNPIIATIYHGLRLRGAAILRDAAIRRTIASILKKALKANKKVLVAAVIGVFLYYWYRYRGH